MTELNNRIEKDLQAILEVISDDDFWSWVKGWYDEQNIMDIINDWDINTKKEAIKELNKIMRK